MLIRLHEPNLIKDSLSPFCRLVSCPKEWKFAVFLLGANFGNKMRWAPFMCLQRPAHKSAIQFSTHSIKTFGLENVSVYPVQLPPSPGAAPVNAAILHLIVHLLLLGLRHVCGRVGEDCRVRRLDLIFREHAAAKVRRSWHDGDRNRHAVVVRSVGVVAAVDDTGSIAAAVQASSVHASAMHAASVYAAAVNARMTNRPCGARFGAGAAPRDPRRAGTRSTPN